MTQDRPEQRSRFKECSHPLVDGKVVGEIALTANEYKTAQRLTDDSWLCVVFNCGSQPQVTTIQNPARFDWEPLSKIDCYRIGAETILKD